GRTPPSYSAWDRFFLNWLTPTELKVGGNYSLDTLATSNKAYLITQNGNFNMSSTNPSPVEFFTLENRQQKGWDTYLPGHGMLVTHIFYNASDWQQNIVNNNAAAMGVDIVEADGTALTETSSVDPTLSGDPFPGTSNVTSYNPSLRDGTDLLKPVKNIRETNGIITFTLSKIATLANSTEVYFNNIAFVSSAQDASKTNVPANMIMNASNPANYLNPGSIFRFKMQCLNKKRDGTNIVSALCKVRCNDPCITITDSTAELNNIEYNSTTWTTDEFEVAIKNNAPVGHILHFDFIISEGSTDYYTYQVPIPVSPLSLQSITVDDDNNPDSRGNNNGICEPNEIIETLPSLQNISPLMVDSVIGTFDNYYSDTEGIHVWKNKAGSNGLVVNSSFWNYSFGAPHAIAAGATNILPQYDFVFNYNFLSTYHFTLGLAMSGKSQLFSGYQTDINWLIPIDYNAGYPDFNTGILSNNIGKIELYPNPTHGILNINMGRDNVDGYTINIVNTLCEKVYVSKLNTARVSIDISKIGKPGLFIIQILNQAGAVILDKKILFIN
ncbi:MAG: T9SS type A sorting domain-containing protein, partial [Bacteroidota bacterium]|nr:T9SS type A sorting domain-containing protein [Bacteroidota bacterium]